MINAKSIVKPIIVALLLVYTAATYGQTKTSATQTAKPSSSPSQKPTTKTTPTTSTKVETTNTATTSSQYIPEKGRIISAELLNKYISVDSDYKKNIEMSGDKKTIIDKNNLMYIMQLQRKYKIEDESLTKILNSPENKKLVESLNERMAPKQDAVLAQPILQTE